MRTNGLRVLAYLLNREASHTDLQITQKIDKRPFLGVHEALECAVTNYALFSAFACSRRKAAIPLYSIPILGARVTITAPWVI